MDKVFLIARREYLSYVKAWGFWLGILMAPLIMLIAIGLPSLIESSQPARYFTIISDNQAFKNELLNSFSERRERIALEMLDQADSIANTGSKQRFEALRAEGRTVDEALEATLPNAAMAIPNQNYLFVEPPATTPDKITPYLLGERLVAGERGERELHAAIFIFEDRIEYWSKSVVGTDLESAIRRVSSKLALDAAFDSAGISRNFVENARDNALEVTRKSPAVESSTGDVSIADRAPYIMALGLSFMLWLLIFSVVNYLLTGTIEERSNKIFDTLLTSVTLPQLLSGKLLGVLGLSLTLIAVWVTGAGVGAFAARDHIPEDVFSILSEIASPELIIPTLISFILGYLMYGSLFLAAGSLCDSIQEAQALFSPIFIIMMIPLFLLPVAIDSPDSPVLEVVSWVPLLTPFLLILRIPNDLPLWLTILQIVWMFGFTLFMIWIGTQVYRAGAVHGMGLREARSWIVERFRRQPADDNEMSA